MIATKYKVVTNDLQSLGLRKNPTILTYPIGEWVNSPTIKANNDDDGGIWVANTKSAAKNLLKYMKRKYNRECMIFLTQIDNILYQNNYRVKTNRVKLLERVEA